MEKVNNYIYTFLNRISGCFLTGYSLANYCCNRKIDFNNKISIGFINCSLEYLNSRLMTFNLPIVSYGEDHIESRYDGFKLLFCVYNNDRKGYVKNGKHYIKKDWINCSEQFASEIREKNQNMCSNGIWRIPISQTEPIHFNVPYKAGHVLDEYDNYWWEKIEHTKNDWGITDIFFDDERKKSGLELIGQMYDCGKKSGIDHAMFLGYGTLLGIVRHGDFLPHDRDMDMCIVADWITKEQAYNYVKECEDSGLGKYRWRCPEYRKDNGMPLWFSLGPKDPVQQHGVKCCNWFWFNYSSHWWHSKGGQWVSPSKFSQKRISYSINDSAIAKGVPDNCLSKLSTYSFFGIDILVPDKVGHCLDEWYPSAWMIPNNCSSAHTNIMVIGDWKDGNTWRISG